MHITLTCQIKEGERAIRFFSFSHDGYDTEHLFARVLEVMNPKELSNRYPPSDGYLFSILITVDGVDSGQSIPGFTITPDFLAVCVCLKMPIIIVINARVSREQGGSSVGAYYYIADDKDLDIGAINSASGSKPSLLERKGEMGRHVINKTNTWGIECRSFDSLADQPINSLIEAIKHPTELGLYCKEHNLHTHIDVTCYGIYVPRVNITLTTSFLYFCHCLGVEWVDIDAMF